MIFVQRQKGEGASFMRVAAEAALIRNCEKCEKYVMMMADNQ
jgi:hypothetical protein